MYASQLWRDFRKAYIRRWRVAYNFGCMAPYNLPWRVSARGVRKGRGGIEKKPLSLIFYKNFITFAKKINCFRILSAC